jgi:hypothetical protein
MTSTHSMAAVRRATISVLRAALLAATHAGAQHAETASRTRKEYSA